MYEKGTTTVAASAIRLGEAIIFRVVLDTRYGNGYGWNGITDGGGN